MKEFKVGPEGINKVLTKFKKKIRESRILVEMQERQYYEKASVKERKKRSKALFRNKLQNKKDKNNDFNF